MSLRGDNGLEGIYACEVFNSENDLQKLEIGSHVVQLYREIFRLHLHFENLSQICHRLTAAQCEERDFLRGIISRRKEWKTLDVVPVKVRERDKDLILLVAHGAEIPAQVSQSRSGVDDGDAIRVPDFQARGVATELLETRIANGN